MFEIVVGLTLLFFWYIGVMTTHLVTKDIRIGKFLLYAGIPTLIWWIGDGYEVARENTYIQQTKERVLVSTSPSHTQIDGNMNGSFLYFSGSIGEVRVYLLREKVSEGLYEDFQVKNKVYIREDSSLKNTGRFIQNFQCKNVHESYEFILWKIVDMSYEMCEYMNQEIVVPVGSVVKEIVI